MMENPIFSSESFVSPSNVINNYLVIRVTFHPNLTATQTLAFTPGIGMARVSCASAFVQSGDLLCYARLYQSMASGQVMYARAVNTTTGEDIGPQFVMIQKSVPTASSYMFYNFTLKPSFVVYFVNSTSFQGYALQLRQIYTPDQNNPYSGRMSINSLECLGTLENLFRSLLPSANSNMFLLDDLGMMVIAPNSTFRYSATNNPDPTISAVGAYLAGQYGQSGPSAMSLTGNFTMASIDLLGTPTILAIQVVAMPGTAQNFTLIIFTPRSDFYGEVEWFIEICQV
ncbi:hypothetical protein HDU84_001701 [Entophlyctis sp. JEL0112]|nr:hypothetical protein HDU84_001701 [Entophlyctis sp. JEL0112]